jgi:divalent metal cation (Fe/Co/Zn/Cd) transporter
MKKAGIVIMVIGVILTLFTAITFFTKKKVVDIGSLEITADKPHRLSWSPLIGVAIIGVGGVITLVSKK